jgi:ubiquinone/menaquinone biosynthesis C-methylase UbiE
MANRDIHFDTIASSYDEQLPQHIRNYLLKKKTRLTVKTLKKYKITKGKGIDLGCGTGWYLKMISEYGYDMVGIDSSEQLVKEASRHIQDTPAMVKGGNILSMDFQPRSFDFAYCINSLHHLKNKEELCRALSEINRIIKKDGLLIIHELNAFFFFRFFLNYIFPLTNKIDKFGGECWIKPKELSTLGSFTLQETYYYTFFPHIIPKSLFGFFRRVNSYMERVSMRRFGVHYMAVLRKKC